MASLSYDLPSYRNYVRFSHTRHLLVEGRSDKRLFQALFDQLSTRVNLPNHGGCVEIDTAESLINFPNAAEGIGNREKVERVCQSVEGQPFAEKLVGFVDREFREFDFAPDLRDRISGHKVSGRLVWSRGHSIENYLFDFDILRRPLRSLSTTDRFREALDLFETVFQTTIRLACAASIAGYRLGKLNLVSKSVNWEVLTIDPAQGQLALDYDAWKQKLVKRHSLPAEQTSALVEQVRSWSSVVGSSDWHIARWMCHGHIGLAFVWAAYGRCVHEVCHRASSDHKKAAAEARKVLKADSSVRFNVCAEWWVQRALGNHCDWPVEVLQLLGLELAP